MIVFKFSKNTEDSYRDNAMNFGKIKEYLEKSGKAGMNTSNILNEGCYKSMGWCYSFTDEMNTYLVKQYGQWRQYYAPNAKLLKKCLHGHVERMRLLDKRVRLS